MVASALDLSTAFGRFGLGPRAGDLAVISQDARGYVAAQLGGPQAALVPEGELISAAAGLATIFYRHGKVAATRGKPAGPAMAPDQATAPEDQAGGDAGGYHPELRPDLSTGQQILLRELESRLDLAVATRTPLLERLALFWTNHFVVSTGRPKLGFIAGAYEREAIRPHMLGRFEDLLIAATLHQAMLLYLDNQTSVGPQSPAGRRRDDGVNENLARELLELHTVGIGEGYTQADVIALAKVLTGWRYRLEKPVTPETGKVMFEPRLHQPGPKTVLGKRYDDAGPDEAMAVLRDLARHPATARQIARRLAGHFVADPPPPALVDRLAARYRDSGGDLTAVYKVLVAAPEAWALPPVKLRPPAEFVLAAARLLGRRPVPPRPLLALEGMGQPYFGAPSPKGWPDGNEAWVTADSVKSRLDWSLQVADRLIDTDDVPALADGLLGAALSAPTRAALAGAATRQQALAILMMSPELQRR